MPGKYTDDEALSILESRKTETATSWTNKRDLWNEIYSLYRFWTSTSGAVNRGEKSNVFIPIAFSIIETKLPRIVQALLGLDPFFAVEGKTSKDHKNAQFMSDAMNFTLTEEINAFFPIMMWWKESLLYGNSYMNVWYEQELSQVKKRIPVGYANELIGYDYKPSVEVDYDGPTLNHLDIFDCFPAPYGTRINGRGYERMPYFILRSEPNAEYLKLMASKGVLKKEAVDEIIKRYPQGFGQIDRERTDRMSYNRMTNTAQPDTKAPRYEMYTCFERDWWTAEIGGTLTRNEENPYGDNRIPIVYAVDTPVPHEHFGIGQIEPIIKLQYYANDIEDLKIDYLVKSINPGAAISADSFLDPQKFMDDPDGIHVVKGNPALAFSLINRATSTPFNATNEQINIERLIDKVLGQSDVSRGVSRPGSDTATEVVSLIEQANFRFDLSVRILKNESLIPMLDMVADRMQQFWPYEKEIKQYTESGDPIFMNVPLSNILGKYRFKIKTNPAHGNKAVYANTLMKFLQVVSADQGQHPGLVIEIAKYLEIQNADEMFDNPAEKAVMMVAQAAAEGLLANSKQAALVLSQVLNILAPPGSPIAQKMASSMQKEGGGGPQLGNVENNADVAQETGANLGQATRR